MAVDPIVVVVDLFRERNNLSVDEFIALNARYSIIDFVADRCESLSRGGNEGVLEDLQEYIEKQKLTGLS